MAAPVHDLSAIPSAPFDDLISTAGGDEQQWERRAMAVAATRIDAARTRLQRLGVIADGLGPERGGTTLRSHDPPTAE